MTRPERILVTGGTGVLGRELVRRLQRQVDVRVLSRRPSPEPGFVQGDLETGEGLAAAVAGVDVIVHCASG
jgi:nucleoside-diphosphate-sugar epimerase